MRLKDVDQKQFEFKEEVPRGLRRKAHRKSRVPNSDKIKIVHQALVGKELYKDIAAEYRISIMLVSQLVKKAKQNRSFIDELISEASRKENKQETLRDYIENMN